ncbi:bifunctional hydroxymethylpyrimidine kinase/phosphomethylpyrimidine kinase [Specibacter cremeus]|uniref:bifunctional hydroxymethylpyrimidine kinase/phosphomethylpyrimidine kinase n=1 Tax=Specibacter cremeus TaxID=1629051 RepID=UPI001F0B8AF3|nr:bifunctional hydroxymethylpyrimidine kinase/phosphomethylpyrimidine kinase [Specibacter cremeus]
MISTPMNSVPHVLSIAGSDPSGGAGIQADLKSIAAQGGYGMAAVTALTAQNTQGVRAVHVPPADFLTRQLEAISDDISVDAVKIGMLPDAAVMRAVGDWLAKTRPAVVVLDPVMVATSGDRLLAPEAEAALGGLLRHVHLVTPNLPELAALLGTPEAATWEEALEQGKQLAVGADVRVLVKGGHLTGDQCPDALVAPDGSVQEFPAARVDTRNTHGTGCSLSAAVATVQARVGEWTTAVRTAKTWLTGALATSAELEVGHGHGPVNHFHALWASAAPAGDEFSRELWDGIGGIRDGIFELPFIKSLADGTLDRGAFEYYLGQDALYLNAYSRVLARAGQLAPTDAEQRFWAGGALNCLEVELALHKSWLGDTPGGPGAGLVQGPVTKAYVDHLLAVAAMGSYGEVVAAVLPCYWLYSDVGAVLHAEYRAAHPEGGHPYGSWLDTYADDAFAEATRTAIGILDAAARRGSADDRDRMRQAFTHSSRFELEFFDAPRRHAAPGGS